MADANTLPVSPDVVALVRARAAETHRDPQEITDEILRTALAPDYFRGDAERRAFNQGLKDRIAEVRAGGPVVSEAESLAALGLEPDTDDE